jgi:hypothetical protein
MPEERPECSRMQISGSRTAAVSLHPNPCGDSIGQHVLQIALPFGNRADLDAGRGGHALVGAGLEKLAQIEVRPLTVELDDEVFIGSMGAPCVARRCLSQPRPNVPKCWHPDAADPR